MSNTVGLILLIIMGLVYFSHNRKEKKAKEKEIIDRNKLYNDNIVKTYIDFYSRIREIVPNKTNDEYDEIAKQHGVNRKIYNVNWEQINNGIKNK